MTDIFILLKWVKLSKNKLNSFHGRKVQNNIRIIKMGKDLLKYLTMDESEDEDTEKEKKEKKEEEEEEEEEEAS